MRRLISPYILTFSTPSNSFSTASNSFSTSSNSTLDLRNSLAVVLYLVRLCLCILFRLPVLVLLRFGCVCACVVVGPSLFGGGAGVSSFVYRSRWTVWFLALGGRWHIRSSKTARRASAHLHLHPTPRWSGYRSTGQAKRLALYVHHG